MHIELEERVLEIDTKKIIKKLEKLGAIKVGEWHQKRYVYDFHPVRKSEWIRLRTNGIETTLTYKNVMKDTIDGTKELEIVVDSFEETNEMLNILGYHHRSFQENKRIRYILNNVEIDIDTWPMIPTYMELEGNSIEEIKQIEELLGVDKTKITNLDCQNIYQDIYKIDIDKIGDLKF
jgi:adenylate cyclase class 2